MQKINPLVTRLPTVDEVAGAIARAEGWEFSPGFSFENAPADHSRAQLFLAIARAVLSEIRTLCVADPRGWYTLDEIRAAFAAADLERDFDTFYPQLPAYLLAWPEEAFAEAWHNGVDTGRQADFQRFMSALRADSASTIEGVNHARHVQLER